jgi:hypothetical protein
MTHRSAGKITALVLASMALVLAGAGTGRAFFQKTDVEGTIGTDIGGVWLAMYYMMPSFRVRLDAPAEDAGLPFEVGPLGDELSPLLGEHPEGVVITKISDPGWGGRFGVFQGDVVTKLNTSEVGSTEDFQKALKGVTAKYFYLTLRRPALAQTKARILKIQYEASDSDDGESSAIADETIRVMALDGVLPFQSDMDAARRHHKLYTPPSDVVEQLEKNWYRLPAPEKPVFVSGEHRVVAASDYDSALREDTNLKDTTFAIVTKLQGNPLTGGGGTTIGVHGIQHTGSKQISGTYVESTIATAPFPISIEFNGRFTMTRLADFSNEDVDYRLAQAKKDNSTAKDDDEDEDVKLAPDIPANLQ